MRKYFVTIALATALTATAELEVYQNHYTPNPADYTNRISLTQKKLLAGFNDETFDGFKAADGYKLELHTPNIFNMPAHEGTTAIVVTPPADIPGSTWRTIRKDFDQPLDLRATPAVEYAIFTQESPVTKQWTRLRVYSGNKSFDAVTQIIPGLWRTVTFQLSDCPFLNKITAIEVGMMIDMDENWGVGRSFVLDGLTVGKPLDLAFMTKESVDVFKAQGGKVSWKSDALRFSFGADGPQLSSPDLRGSRNSIYNPPLQVRNTFFVVMQNNSDVDSVRLRWRTSEGLSGAKVFPLKRRSAMSAYYFNVSDVAEAKGNLEWFAMEPVGGGRGEWLIDQIRFEQEAPITQHGGVVEKCVATATTVSVTGKADAGLDSVVVYEWPMYADEWALSKLTRLGSAATTADGHFSIEFANSRLDGKMTHLSSRLLAVAYGPSSKELRLVSPSNGGREAFYIENWRDFTRNPWAFSLPDRTFDVKKYGAKGDGFTDDTRALQKAIDACSQAGGGKVLIPEGRFVATHLMLKSNVDLHFADGAVLWQSYDQRHYDYVPAYGHDFVIPNCPWTHCLFVNYPLIQANNVDNVKISGRGTIRMADPYTLNPDYGHYARTCSDRIHICPIGITGCKDVEITDIEVVRTNNYNTNFHGDTCIYLGNVRLHEVQCVSGDGFSFGQGAYHVRVERCFFESNDDGIVLSNSYRDPRGKVSPWRHDYDNANHSVRDVMVEHSYINSSRNGGGKAIAFIPWGSTNPDQTKQMLDSIQVYDCVLAGGHSVGTWCDNPHDGKPFTNAEVDDYAPVSNVRIIGNEYRNATDLLCVKPTNIVTDCGLHSASTIVNGDFKDGFAYWTLEGNVTVASSTATVGAKATIKQGLWLVKGDYEVSMLVQGDGKAFVVSYDSDSALSTSKFTSTNFTKTTFAVHIEHDGNYWIGVEAGMGAKLQNVVITKQ